MGWTVSSGCFDRLPGVLILELRRAQIAERGVEASLIVDIVDEAWKVGGDVLERIAEHPVKRVHELLPWNLAGTPRRLDQRNAA